MSKKPRTKAEWEELLTRQKESGQGVKEWCAENGVNVNTMYNQIGKRHKLNAGQMSRQTSKTINTISKKINPEATNTNSVLIEWKELQTSTEQQRETSTKGSVFIEVGSIRLAADVGYPIANLAALCKELRQTC